MPVFAVRTETDFNAGIYDNIVVREGDPAAFAGTNGTAYVVEEVLFSPPTVVTPTDAATLWTPGDTDGAGTAMPGIELWLDASDAATLTLTGDAVDQWNDKSGNNRHATPGLPAKPQSGQTSPSALNMIAIGKDRHLTFPAPGIAAGGARSVMMVMQDYADQTIMDRIMFSLGASTSGAAKARWSVIAFKGTNSFRIEINAGNVASAVNAMGAGLLGATHDGNTTMNGRFLLNGTATAYSNSNHVLATANLPGAIGSRGAGEASDGMGIVGEIVLTSTALSGTILQRLEGYLAHKWGYADLLPASHPFKDAAPLTT